MRALAMGADLDAQGALAAGLDPGVGGLHEDREVGGEQRGLALSEAHFAWSHLWWGLTYPLAALLTTVVPRWAFLSGGAIGLVVLVVAALAHRPRGGRTAPPPGQRAAGRDEGAEMVGYR